MSGFLGKRRVIRLIGGLAVGATMRARKSEFGWPLTVVTENTVGTPVVCERGEVQSHHGRPTLVLEGADHV